MKNYPFAKRLFAALAALAVLTMWSGAALAGQNPSYGTCKELKEVTVSCYVCSTGEYKGSFKTPAQYDYRNSCVSDIFNLIDKCRNTYGTGQDTQVRYSYWLGMTCYSVTWPASGHCDL